MVEHAKAEAIIEAGRLADIATNESITVASSTRWYCSGRSGHNLLASQKRMRLPALLIAHDNMSDAILDITPGLRQIIRKLDLEDPPPADLHCNVLAHLFPSQTPLALDVVLCESKFTAGNSEAREAQFTFKSVASADTSDHHRSFRS